MKNHSVKQNLLVLLGTIICMLVALEVIFRFYFPVDIKKPRISVYNGIKQEWFNGDVLRIFNDGLYTYKPNITFKHCYDGKGMGRFEADNCVTYKTNSLGFRDVEHELKKGNNVYRILILGDSFTVGEGTRFSDIFPIKLAESFRKKRLSGKKVEIINLAMPGANTMNESKIYQYFGKKLNSDMVILQWNTNDFPVSSVLREHRKLIGEDYKKIFSDSKKYQWSALVHYIWYTLKVNKIAKGLIHLSNERLERGKLNFYQIKELHKMVKENGTSFYLLLFPELINFSQYPYSKLIKSLRDFCNQEKIPFIDALPELSKHKASKLWVHETDHHPNFIAHDVLFNKILTTLDSSLNPEKK
ncbi:MAG: SGNH/GDSL hydrolase family protein [Nitrospinae bacterium]|nr:SGNH/GDSL hydrolase family protein [Nitrospinota bacterium]